MNPISRQDVQSIVDISRNRIMERMVTKQDVAMVSEALKNLLTLSQQNQQLLRQSEQQRMVLARRVVTLENRLANFENEMRVTSSTILKTAGQRQQIVMPTPQPEETAQKSQSQYASYYRPA